MPLPKKYYTELDKQLNAIEVLSKFVSDPKLRKAIDEISDKPDLHVEIRKDVAGWLAQRGVKIPPGVSVTFKPNNFFLLFCAFRHCILITESHGIEIW